MVFVHPLHEVIGDVVSSIVVTGIFKVYRYQLPTLGGGGAFFIEYIACK